VIERLPAYAPELNPVEGPWSSLKAVELATLVRPLAEVIDQAFAAGGTATGLTPTDEWHEDETGWHRSVRR
jgi:hypothetical protein